MKRTMVAALAAMMLPIMVPLLYPEPMAVQHLIEDQQRTLSTR